MNNQVVLKPRVPKRRKKTGRLFKGFLVVVLATVLTTLAIQASDKFTIPGSSLVAGVGGAGPKAHCASSMVYIPSSGGGFCIDSYEVSAGDHCLYANPSNQTETEANLSDPLCMPLASTARSPWVNIPEHEALQLCAKAGKRLPTNKEWYRAALGTPDLIDANGDSACALGHIGQSSADKTGANAKCISSYGVHDMVGNVWEWIDASVVDGKYDERMLPDEGYVAEVDVDGVPTRTATSSLAAYGDDYFYVNKTGVRGMIRGGFWSLKEKGGTFSINATIPTSFVGNAIGLRCVVDAQ
jgi:formylglycine-generating enzyme required for sulfatase activity